MEQAVEADPGERAQPDQTTLLTGTHKDPSGQRPVSAHPAKGQTVVCFRV